MEREQTILRLPSGTLELLRQEAQDMGLSVNTRILDLIQKGREAESARFSPRKS